MVEDSFASVRFPQTRVSAVLGAGSQDPVARARSFEILAKAYWRPVYAHVRARWHRSPEEARDLTQSFFAQAIEKQYFGRFNPEKALFRTFLKLCLDRFVGENLRSARRLKRGGGTLSLSLDFDAAEVELQQLGLPNADAADSCFDAAWMRHVLGSALEALRKSCQEQGKTTALSLFERHTLQDGPRPSYADLAREHGVSVTQVTNHLAWARREFRRRVLEELREITASEEEYRSEAVTLLGVEP